jgi:RNA polymerase sigma-70 factor (ECF subfamily)
MEPSQELLERLWPDAYRIAYSVLRDHAAAEDAAQESCAVLHRSLHTLRDEGALAAWFYRIVVNESRTIARRRMREIPIADAAVPAVSAPNVEYLDLRSAIEALPTTQRLPIIFHYHYGLRDHEIAGILGISHVAVRFRLFAARRSLKRVLQSRSIDTERDACHEAT